MKTDMNKHIKKIFLKFANLIRFLEIATFVLCLLCLKLPGGNGPASSFGADPGGMSGAAGAVAERLTFCYNKSWTGSMPS